MKKTLIFLSCLALLMCATAQAAPPLLVGQPTFYRNQAVADEESITLPTVTTNYSGHGWVRVSSAGVVQDSCEFEVGSDGNPALIRGTANIALGAACANAKICIGTAGAQNPLILQFRNGAANVEVNFWYY